MVKYSEAYVNNNLIHAGIAEKRLMRVQIECLVTKDERQEDKCMFGTLSREEWERHCDCKRKEYCDIMREFMRQLSSFIEGICQYNSDEFIGRTLHYYSNRGWNGSDDYDFIHLSFNEDLTEEENQEILNVILRLAENFDQLLFTVMYHSVVDDMKCKELAEDKFLKVEGKTIFFNGIYD